MEQWIKTFFDNYVSDMYFPNVHLTDIIEIIIVSIIVYEIMPVSYTHLRSEDGTL